MNNKTGLIASLAAVVGLGSHSPQEGIPISNSNSLMPDPFLNFLNDKGRGTGIPYHTPSRNQRKDRMTAKRRAGHNPRRYKK